MTYAEHHDMMVDEKLVGQYLQNKKIAKDFANEYKLTLLLKGSATVVTDGNRRLRRFGLIILLVF